jgi:hypothetical protein
VKVIRKFIYTKDTGKTSERSAIIITPPRDNYLMLDVSDLNTVEVQELREALAAADKNREEVLDSVQDLIKWRSFKSEGITWTDKIEVQ